MPAIDPWSNPSAAGAADARRMAVHLEERAAYPDQVLVNTALLDALHAAPGQRILEVGSGSGALCRLLAQRVTPGGWVTGVDISYHMAQAGAETYAAGAGPAAALRFQAGGATALPFPDDHFDAACAARLYQHVADPLAVGCEIARTVRPGGRLAVLDWDFETLVVDHPDRELTRRVLHWRADHLGGDAWIGRKLARHLLDAGLRDVQVRPIPVVGHDERTSLPLTLWHAAEVARAGGAISPAEHDAWTGYLRQRLNEGRFFACILYFIGTGSKS